MKSIEELQQKLIASLNASVVQITDNTWQHRGHQGVKAHDEATHLDILIVSPQFETLNTLSKYRLVHQILEEEMKNQIHALELTLYTPIEWQIKSPSHPTIS